MTNYIIDFAGLGLKINPPSTFTIGSIEIHLYGLIIALGLAMVCLGWYFRARLEKARLP